MAVMFLHVVLFYFNFIRHMYADEGWHSRFEYRHSFKGPHLANKQGNVPFWNNYGSAIPSDDQIRVTPSMKDQRGSLWSRTKMPAEFWEIEVTFKISGRGRIGGDGLAIWFTDVEGQLGPVFGAKDKWNGMGLFFDSFDNDGQNNNPYVMLMLNDGTKEYEHFKDGSNQQSGGCLRDFRNRPHPIRVKVRYYKNIVTVFYNNGMSEQDDDFEMCMRAEDISLPVGGHFGISAGTGGLADDHDAMRFITHSLAPPLSPEEKARLEEERRQKRISEEERRRMEDEYNANVKKLETQKQEFKKEHPDKFKQESEKYESVYDRDIRLIYEGSNSIHKLVMSLHGKTGELTKEVNTLHTVIGQQERSQNNGPTQSEVQNLITLQRDVHSIVKERMNDPPTGLDASQLERLESTTRDTLERVNNLLGELQTKKEPCPPCPVVHCVSPAMFIFFTIAQLAAGFAFIWYKNYNEQAAKKFY